MSQDRCKKTKCEHYKTTGQGIGGVTMKAGRCMLADRMVSRLQKCPKEEK